MRLQVRPTFSQASRGLPARRHLSRPSTQLRATESWRVRSFRPLVAIVRWQRSVCDANAEPPRPPLAPVGAGRQPPKLPTSATWASRSLIRGIATPSAFCTSHGLRNCRHASTRSAEESSRSKHSGSTNANPSTSVLRRKPPGMAGGSPPQASVNCVRNLVWVASSLTSWLLQRRAVVVRQLVRSAPSARVVTHLKASREQASSVFNVPMTSELVAFPRVFSQPRMAFGSSNGNAVAVGCGSGVAVTVTVGPVGATVSVGEGVGVGVRLRVGVGDLVGPVAVGDRVGVVVGVGQVKAVQSALQQPPALSQISPACTTPSPHTAQGG